jgi:hypothetical protein
MDSPNDRLGVVDSVRSFPSQVTDRQDESDAAQATSQVTNTASSAGWRAQQTVS